MVLGEDLGLFSVSGLERYHEDIPYCRQVKHLDNGDMGGFSVQGQGLNLMILVGPF